MKKETFNLEGKLITLSVIVEADCITKDFRFIVDTGTKSTIIDEDAARAMWLTRANSKEVQIRGVTGSGTAYEHRIDAISALGVTKRDFNILEHPMPEDAGADGLLGLDFFENTSLTIDFILSEIGIERHL